MFLPNGQRSPDLSTYEKEWDKVSGPIIRMLGPGWELLSTDIDGAVIFEHPHWGREVTLPRKLAYRISQIWHAAVERGVEVDDICYDKSEAEQSEYYLVLEYFAQTPLAQRKLSTPEVGKEYWHKKYGRVKVIKYDGKIIRFLTLVERRRYTINVPLFTTKSYMDPVIGEQDA